MAAATFNSFCSLRETEVTLVFIKSSRLASARSAGRAFGDWASAAVGANPNTPMAMPRAIERRSKRILRQGPNPLKRTPQKSVLRVAARAASRRSAFSQELADTFGSKSSDGLIHLPPIGAHPGKIHSGVPPAEKRSILGNSDELQHDLQELSRGLPRHHEIQNLL